MTDTNETASTESTSAAADTIKTNVENDVKTEVKETESGVIAHLESFAEWAEADVKAALAWLTAKL